MSRLGLVAGIVVCAVTGCGGLDDSPGGSSAGGSSAGGSCGLPALAESDCPEGIGVVELQFAVSDEARNSMLLVDPLKGTVYGDILRPEHVGGGGPTSDAVSIHAVRVDGVDFTVSQSPPSFTASVCAGKFEFLGFLDVDGNAGTPAFADKGDPVTTPGRAKLQPFEVKANLSTKQIITLDQILYCTLTCLNPQICEL